MICSGCWASELNVQPLRRLSDSRHPIQNWTNSTTERRMLAVAPTVFATPQFALKDGTAIKAIVRDASSLEAEGTQMTKHIPGPL